jgi:hypothetical protein
VTSVSARHRLFVASKLLKLRKESFGEMGGQSVVRRAASAPEQKATGFGNRSLNCGNAEDCGQVVKSFPEDTRTRIVQPGHTKYDDVWPVSPKRREQMMIK